MKSKNTLVIVSILVVLVILFLFTYKTMQERKGLVKVVFENGAKAYVEVATSESEKSKGLSQRKTLEKNHGMIFAYNEEQFLYFWMKDTLVNLDVIFLDSDKTIVNFFEMKKCEGDLCTIYPSGVPAQYAIEVSAGFSEANNLAIGQNVEFEL